MVLVFKAVNRTAPSTSKHWSHHTAQREHFSGTAIAESKQSCSEKSRLFSVLEPLRWNEVPTNVRTAEPLSVCSRRLQTDRFRLHLDTEHHSLQTAPKNKNICTCMFVPSHFNHSTHALEVSLIISSYGPQTRADNCFYISFYSISGDVVVSVL